LSLCMKCRPTKYKPGTEVAPRYCSGRSAGVEDGELDPAEIEFVARCPDHRDDPVRLDVQVLATPQRAHRTLTLTRGLAWRQPFSLAGQRVARGDEFPVGCVRFLEAAFEVRREGDPPATPAIRPSRHTPRAADCRRSTS
jgi:hypothetical protein